MELNFIPWFSDGYEDHDETYDIYYRGHVYVGAYPNGGKVDLSGEFEDHPLGTIADTRQDVLGPMIMCRPCALMPWFDDENESYQWYSQEDYIKLVEKHKECRNENNKS